MMSTADVDMTLYFRRKHTPPPSVLLVTARNDNDQYDHISPSIEHRSHQQKIRNLPHMIGLHVNNVDIHDTSTSSFGWQRHSDKTTQINLAPDVAYRNTYLEESKREKSDLNNTYYHIRSSSPHNRPISHSKLNNSLSYIQLESYQQKHSSQQYRTVYDYIQDSIRQIERQRNLKQQNISSRIKRPQNEDSTLRRVLADRKSSTRTSVSNSATTTRTLSSLFNNDLKSPQSFVNYINYSRDIHSTKLNPSHQQQRSILSQN